jgi:hypothetical protein
MNPLKYLLCLRRNYHRYFVPDLALFEEMADDLFPGHCADCGRRRMRSGARWAALKDAPPMRAARVSAEEGA